ncbi:glycosyl transferase [Blastococcus sp. TF02A-35]|uniref:glycosyl transferase n=1 Tax=Blastococcus sp. TF02A-35 TaxID=2559612 RepID=UPI001073D16E|nr:glycosyl transferase [Blastococcus sp. TF02A_35]TFV52996.1 glycosyl transferase [Blastococcus sp. TF02A_35]
MDRPLRVLQSFPEPRPTTNPYLVMLRDALAEVPGLEVRTFSWRRALTGRYDVFHVHWPEILVSGNGPLRTAVRRLLFAALLLRLRLRRTAVVRTVHNLRPHQERSGAAAWLLRRAERRTSAHIRLNDRTPATEGVWGATVVHGHYRGWFEQHPHQASRPGHLVFAGLVRSYKNVPGLVGAFTAADDPGLSLHVAGAPDSPETGEQLRAAAGADERVRLTLRHLDDAELVAAVTEAELVVLPYRDMHNSGAALLALSLDRPVLVPDNEVTADLAAEVGPGWVHRYQGDLTAEVLRDALAALRAEPRAPRPDLSRREWDGAAAAHVEVYRRARR